MDIRTRVKSGPHPMPMQDVSGKLRDVRFDQQAPWVNFDQVQCQNVDFSGLKFKPFNAMNATFDNCDFSRCKFVSGSFGIMTHGSRQCVYRNCRFDRADMRSLLYADNARFERCSFRDTKMEHWRADCAEFVDCTFSGRLNDCRFAGRPWDWEEPAGRKRNEFRGNDFREARLDGVMFVYGIDIAAQMWPEDRRYLRLDRPKERIERVRAAVSHWSDEGAREHALYMLRSHEDRGYEEQHELWTDRDIFAHGQWHEIGTRVWDMLEHALD